MASPAELAALGNYPLGPPPLGQTSNFDDPESRGPLTIVLSSVFIAILWPVLTLRLYSSAWVTRKFGWDDGRAERGSFSLG